ncbi:MAG: PA14 domain-containing protein [Actinomycetota bacterium]|nr:PA14 domain-containing protein [Actinomycetota bacterium]
MRYWFRVTTGPDAESGQVTNSGWVTPTSWTPPTGSLQDGVTYYWHTWTYDGISARRPGWVRKFSVNRRLGASGPSPTDTVGPATVNLATGNLAVQTASPSLATVGGGLGLSFSYNTQALPSRGLSAAYFADWNANRAFDEDLFVRRVDPHVYFDWYGGSPVPNLPPDNFLVRWTGYLTVPVAGAYSFGAASDDGVRMWVNNAPVLDRWFDQATWPAPVFDARTVTLAAGQTVPITIEYYEAGFSAAVNAAVRGPVPDQTIPVSWLSPGPPTLPQGWTASADLDGEVTYAQARRSDHAVTLVEVDGATHEYRRTTTGWAPPPDEDGVLASNPDGTLALTGDDGATYTFGADGNLTSLTSGADDRNPAAPRYSWSGQPARLDAITDPVSARQVTLTYAGSGSCATPPAGFQAPPAGMLFRIAYWDGTETRLHYFAGQLARLEDPGGEVTDFAYQDGRLTAVRDPLAADAVAAGRRPDDATTRTEVAYDTAGKVSSITLPAPNAGAPRPAHFYTYGPGSTDVHVAGLSEPNGYARRVAFDAAARQTADTDATRRSSTTEWDAGDLQLSGTDAGGLRTTTIYDRAHRPTDTYGPPPPPGSAPTAARRPATRGGCPGPRPPTTRASTAWPPPTGTTPASPAPPSCTPPAWASRAGRSASTGAGPRRRTWDGSTTGSPSRGGQTRGASPTRWPGRVIASGSTSSRSPPTPSSTCTGLARGARGWWCPGPT